MEFESAYESHDSKLATIRSSNGKFRFLGFVTVKAVVDHLARTNVSIALPHVTTLATTAANRQNLQAMFLKTHRLNRMAHN